MESRAYLLIAFFGLFACANALVPLLHASSPHRVNDHYIFTFHEHVTKGQRDNHISEVQKEQAFGNVVNHIYDFGNFTGYAAKLNSTYVSVLQRRGDLFASVEADQKVYASQSCQQQSGAVWGLNRISERTLNLNTIYKYGSTAGAGVTSYVVDTGINMKHVEFTGRVTWGGNWADKENDDCNGHGTHVASTLGGTTYGVAKKTSLVAVKVLSCDGSGTNAGVIAGVQFVANDRTSKRRPSVANMSLGGGYSSALNNAVATAVKAGVTFVVAAGNENQDACNTSPASERSAISVGATTVDDSSGAQKDARAYFSNWGTCVDILAPGDLITAAWIGSSTAVKTISGTSMASPHVAGAAALYVAQNTNASPASVKSHLTGASTSNAVSLDCDSTKTTCSKTPNKLLYSACA